MFNENDTVTDRDLALAMEWQSTKDTLKELLDKYQGDMNAAEHGIIEIALPVFQNASQATKECIFVYLYGLVHAMRS